MPTSMPQIIMPVLRMAGTIPDDEIRSVLDVGPGYGKFGLLLREYLKQLRRLVAVEKHRPYLTQFPWLRHLYDEVIVADVLDLDPDFLAEFDLVLMIDVIEHIEKSAALSLLEQLPNRVLISTPVEYFPNLPDHPTEAHVSHWSREDFDHRRIEASRKGEGPLGSWVLLLGPADTDATVGREAT